MATDKREPNKVLKLCSPSGAPPVIYQWPLILNETLNEAEEIVETICWVCQDFPDLKAPVENYILNDFDITSYESMKAVCDKYNKAITNIRKLWSGCQPPLCINAPPSADLLKHIMTQVYNHAIDNVVSLNQYEPFSPEVYGETSYELVEEVIKEAKLTEDDIFLDLGSGVGNVVLQVAARIGPRECYGIEKADKPAAYSKEMQKHFKKWMKWYGKSFGDFELFFGDFLSSEFTELIGKATVIFVNNFAFGPTVNHQLKLKFQSLKDGTRIVSSCEFCPLNFRINDRSLGDIGAIMDVHLLSPLKGRVSWTHNKVNFYLQVIDRTLLEKYFYFKSHPEEEPPEELRRKLFPKELQPNSEGEDTSNKSTPTRGKKKNGEVPGKQSKQLSVTQFSSVLGKQLELFLSLTKSPRWITQLKHQIQEEKARKAHLSSLVGGLENEVAILQKESVDSIEKGMKQLGVAPTTPEGLLARAKSIRNKNRQLKQNVGRAENEVSTLQKQVDLLCQAAQQVNKFVIPQNLKTSKVTLSQNFGKKKKSAVHKAKQSFSQGHRKSSNSGLDQLIRASEIQLSSPPTSIIPSFSSVTSVPLESALQSSQSSDEVLVAEALSSLATFSTSVSPNRTKYGDTASSHLRGMQVATPTGATCVVPTETSSFVSRESQSHHFAVKPYLVSNSQIVQEEQKMGSVAGDESYLLTIETVDTERQKRMSVDSSISNNRHSVAAAPPTRETSRSSSAKGITSGKEKQRKKAIPPPFHPPNLSPLTIAAASSTTEVSWSTTLPTCSPVTSVSQNDLVLVQCSSSIPRRKSSKLQIPKALLQKDSFDGNFSEVSSSSPVLDLLSPNSDLSGQLQNGTLNPKRPKMQIPDDASSSKRLPNPLSSHTTSPSSSTIDLQPLPQGVLPLAPPFLVPSLKTGDGVSAMWPGGYLTALANMQKSLTSPVMVPSVSSPGSFLSPTTMPASQPQWQAMFPFSSLTSQAGAGIQSSKTFSALDLQYPFQKTVPGMQLLPFMGPMMSYPTSQPSDSLPSATPPVSLPSATPPVSLPSATPPSSLPSATQPASLPNATPPASLSSGMPLLPINPHLLMPGQFGNMVTPFTGALPSAPPNLPSASTSLPLMMLPNQLALMKAMGSGVAKDTLTGSMTPPPFVSGSQFQGKTGPVVQDQQSFVGLNQAGIQQQMMFSPLVLGSLPGAPGVTGLRKASSSTEPLPTSKAGQKAKQKRRYSRKKTNEMKKTEPPPELIESSTSETKPQNDLLHNAHKPGRSPNRSQQRSKRESNKQQELLSNGSPKTTSKVNSLECGSDKASPKMSAEQLDGSVQDDSTSFQSKTDKESEVTKSSLKSTMEDSNCSSCTSLPAVAPLSCNLDEATTLLSLNQPFTFSSPTAKEDSQCPQKEAVSSTSDSRQGNPGQRGRTSSLTAAEAMLMLNTGGQADSLPEDDHSLKALPVSDARHSKDSSHSEEITAPIHPHTQTANLPEAGGSSDSQEATLSVPSEKDVVVLSSRARKGLSSVSSDSSIETHLALALSTELSSQPVDRPSFSNAAMPSSLSTASEDEQPQPESSTSGNASEQSKVGHHSDEQPSNTERCDESVCPPSTCNGNIKQPDMIGERPEFDVDRKGAASKYPPSFSTPPPSTDQEGRETMNSTPMDILSSKGRSQISFKISSPQKTSRKISSRRFSCPTPRDHGNRREVQRSSASAVQSLGRDKLSFHMSRYSSYVTSKTEQPNQYSAETSKSGKGTSKSGKDGRETVNWKRWHEHKGHTHNTGRPVQVNGHLEQGQSGHSHQKHRYDINLQEHNHLKRPYSDSSLFPLNKKKRPSI